MQLPVEEEAWQVSWVAPTTTVPAPPLPAAEPRGSLHLPREFKPSRPRTKAHRPLLCSRASARTRRAKMVAAMRQPRRRPAPSHRAMERHQRCYQQERSATLLRRSKTAQAEDQAAGVCGIDETDRYRPVPVPVPVPVPDWCRVRSKARSSYLESNTDVAPMSRHGVARLAPDAGGQEQSGTG